jgi:hypothetical protein
MTDKEKRAIEMFRGRMDPIRLYNCDLQKYYNYYGVFIADISYLTRYDEDESACFDALKYIDLDPPKTAYDELDDYIFRIKYEDWNTECIFDMIKSFKDKYESQLKEMIEVKE